MKKRKNNPSASIPGIYLERNYLCINCFMCEVRGLAALLYSPLAIRQVLYRMSKILSRNTAGRANSYSILLCHNMLCALAFFEQHIALQGRTMPYGTCRNAAHNTCPHAWQYRMGSLAPCGSSYQLKSHLRHINRIGPRHCWHPLKSRADKKAATCCPTHRQILFEHIDFLYLLYRF